MTSRDPPPGAFTAVLVVFVVFAVLTGYQAGRESGMNERAAAIIKILDDLVDLKTSHLLYGGHIEPGYDAEDVDAAIARIRKELEAPSDDSP